MTEPNFFIIGAAKAGTTSLSSLLDAHPQAAIGRLKEPHFFSYDLCYQLGWQRYLSLYEDCSGRKAIGEASTSYSRVRYHPRAPDRIKKHLPEARIIYMVRHPLERMEAAYVEHCCTPDRRAFQSINEAVRLEPMIVDSSRYWEVFDAYRQRFGESRVAVVWFEEYVVDTTAVFQSVCRFLGIDHTVRPRLAVERMNSRAEARARLARIGRGHLVVNTTWDRSTRQAIVKEIRDDNQRFLGHFGRPLDYWGDLY